MFYRLLYIFYIFLLGTFKKSVFFNPPEDLQIDYKSLNAQAIIAPVTRQKLRKLHVCEDCSSFVVICRIQYNQTI